MEEKQETAKSDQEELDFDRDALDRWQDDGGRCLSIASRIVWQ